MNNSFWQFISQLFNKVFNFELDLYGFPLSIKTFIYISFLLFILVRILDNVGKGNLPRKFTQSKKDKPSERKEGGN